MARTSLSAAAIFVASIAVATSAGKGDSHQFASPTRDLVAVPFSGLRGQVVAADTGAPLVDVVLSLRPADQLATRIPAGTPTNPPIAPTVRPDANGRFEFTNVPPGRYRLTVDPGLTAARYLPVRHPDPRAEDAAPITIVANQAHEPVVVALPRAAAITGRIVDERGNGLAFVIVTAQEWLPGDRRRMWLGSAAGLIARTDDEGNFRLFGMAPGEYVIAATPPRQGSLTMAATVAIPGMGPPTYYPGTPDIAAAARIRVNSGDEHGPIQFTLATVRLCRIRGTVFDTRGQPASSVSVHLYGEGQLPVTPSSNLSLARQSTRPDGTFELSDVQPGTHTLSIVHFGQHGSEFAWMPITVADDVDDVVLRLQAGVSLKGRVVFEGQAPEPLPTMYVRSLPARAGGGNGAGVMPGDDLTFELANLFGPTYVRPDGPAGWHLKAVLHDGKDIADTAVEFSDDGPPVQVVLTRDAAVVTGVVRTAAGVPADSMVIVMSEDPALWTERATTTKMMPTSTDGRYRVEGLRAGRYLVVATIRESEGMNIGITPAYFELLAKHATPVTLGEHESKPLDLKRVALR